jgi:hypothetical protein
MKISGIVVLWFFAISAHAQIRDRASIDTNKAPLYIVNGKIDTLNTKIRPGDILEVNLVTGPNATAIYGVKGTYGVVNTITKQYAILQYENKLALLCDKYKKYLAQKGNDDTKLAYVVDDVILQPGLKSTIEQLYALPPNNIKKVSFKKDSHFTTDATVVIITK